MKKFSSLIAFALTVLAIMCLSSACTPAPPNEKRIEEDLLSCSLNVLNEENCGFSGNRSMEIDSVEIERRQTDDKVDNPYCKIVMHDDDMRATVYYVLEYNYYDKGGWILDGHSPYEGNTIEALHGADEADVRDQFLTNNYDGDYELTYVSDTPELEKNKHTFVYEYTRKTPTCVLQGTMELPAYFDSASGKWTNSLSPDIYDETVAQWLLSNEWDVTLYLLYVRFQITDIDLGNNTATISCGAINSYSADKYEKRITPSTQTVNITNENGVIYFDPIDVGYHDFIFHCDDRITISLTTYGINVYSQEQKADYPASCIMN